MANIFYLSVRLKGDDIILQNKVGLKLFGDTPENVAKEEAFGLANIQAKTLITKNIEYGFVMDLKDEVTNWQSLEVDLFDELDALSPTMQELIKDLGDAIYGNLKPDYDGWLKKFEDKGYTFEWDMDGHAYKLRLLTEEEKEWIAFHTQYNDNVNYILVSDLNEIKDLLDSTASTSWGQGLIDNFWKLASYSPPHKDSQPSELYCHFDDLNKVCEKQYETLKETKSNFGVKKLVKEFYSLVEDLPNFDKTGSISGMKKMYYGKQALLVRCGNYIYNVTSEPAIYFKLAQ